jgi:tRNA threonylcarbamoyladenosine biosynthesis protein TsaB
MILFIDSTNFDAVTYALTGEKVFQKTFQADPHESHEVLGFLEKFLRLAKVKPGEIKKIIVNKGPGSYTGTRIGVTHALALGFAWGVPMEALEQKKFLKKLQLK